MVHGKSSLLISINRKCITHDSSYHICVHVYVMGIFVISEVSCIISNSKYIIIIMLVRSSIGLP
jgi:hypothetical protein